MQAILWIILVIVNFPVYYGAFRLIFDSTDDFVESLKFAIQPDIVSWISGEGWDDFIAEMKLSLWLFVSIGAVCGEAYLFGMF